MAIITIPTFQETRDRVNADFKAFLDPSVRPELPVGVIPSIAANLAAGEYANYLMNLRTGEGSFFATAQGDALAELAAPFGVQRRAGTPAQGVARFTYSANLPFGNSGANFRVNLTDNEGNQYFADVPGYFFDGSTTYLLQNVQTVNVGVGANIDAGTRFNFVNLTGIHPQLLTPVTNIFTNNLVSIVADIPFTGGSGAESDDELRARFLQVLLTTTAGGTIKEWQNWTREVSGVTRVFVRTLTPGTVDIYPVFDANNQNLPSTANLTAVTNHLNQFRPASVEMRVLAFEPAVTAVNARIKPFNTANVLATQKAIDDVVVAFGRLGENFLYSRLWRAISEVSGLDDWDITSPTTDVTITGTQLFVPSVTVTEKP